MSPFTRSVGSVAIVGPVDVSDRAARLLGHVSIDGQPVTVTIDGQPVQVVGAETRDGKSVLLVLDESTRHLLQVAGDQR